MNINTKISTRLILQMVLFATLTGTAILFDIYLEKHPDTFTELDSDHEEETKDQGIVYLISQTFTLNVKSPVQTSNGNRFYAHGHIKFIQIYHHLRNLQAYKNKKEIPHMPVYLVCHNLLFKQSYFSSSDDDPVHL